MWRGSTFLQQQLSLWTASDLDACVLSLFSLVWLFTILRTVASSFHGILQTWMLEVVAMLFTRGSFPPCDPTRISSESVCNAGDLGSIPGQEEPLEKGITISMWYYMLGVGIFFSNMLMSFEISSEIQRKHNEMLATWKSGDGDKGPQKKENINVQQILKNWETNDEETAKLMHYKSACGKFCA